MFFIFQRKPCNSNKGCLHICRNFIFIGKIKANLNSNPFGYLAAYCTYAAYSKKIESRPSGTVADSFFISRFKQKMAAQSRNVVSVV